MPDGGALGQEEAAVDEGLGSVADEGVGPGGAPEVNAHQGVGWQLGQFHVSHRRKVSPAYKIKTPAVVRPWGATNSLGMS